MIIARTVQELQRAIRTLSPSAHPGFVPTMGALHDGHMSLAELSVRGNKLTVCSIFVNPKQFNDSADFSAYPRNENADCAMLEQHGCGIAFIPSLEVVYPGDPDPGFDFGGLATVMEGAHRPGHFQGVASVVYRLFKMVDPARAYFGEKDFQQMAVIRSLVSQSGLAVQVVACPTIRAGDGLAMSSRNIRLTPAERLSAGTIYRSLTMARELFPDAASNEIRKRVKNLIEKGGIFQLEYFEIADEATLQPLDPDNAPQRARAFIAVRASRTRLIDNLALG